MEDGGLHVHTRSSTPLHTKPEGRRLAGEQPRLQGVGTPRYNLWFTQEPAYKAGTPCSLTLSRSNRSTNTFKACVKPKDMINMLFNGLKNFF
jgi:hypothetical protein